MERYDGKPFLRLLEAFILDRIGRLPAEDQAVLAAMTPHLRETFERRGRWDEIVAAAMAFEPEVDESIRRDWARWSAQHGDADPAAFARVLSDAIIAD